MSTDDLTGGGRRCIRSSETAPFAGTGEAMGARRCAQGAPLTATATLRHRGQRRAYCDVTELFRRYQDDPDFRGNLSNLSFDATY